MARPSLRVTRARSQSLAAQEGNVGRRNEGPAHSPAKKRARLAPAKELLPSGDSGVQAAVSPVATKKKMKALLDPSTAVLANLAALQRKAARIAEMLDERYPNPEVPLVASGSFQLLCAVILSAQV